MMANIFRKQQGFKSKIMKTEGKYSDGSQNYKCKQEVANKNYIMLNNIYNLNLHIETLYVTLTNKISLSGEPSLAVSAGIRLGMCPRVSCTHSHIIVQKT